jgi:hypothetical protein
MRRLPLDTVHHMACRINVQIAHLDTVHEGRVRGLPALAQIICHLLALGEHPVLADRRQPLEQGVAAQLQGLPNQALGFEADIPGRTRVQRRSLQTETSNHR